MKPTTLLIVWHSVTGGSEQLAQAAFSGAQETGEDEATTCLVRREHCSDVTPADVLAADGYMFVCPENLAAIAGTMKEFFDRCYYPVLGQIEARPYATIVCAGSDGQNACAQIARIATGWRLKPIAQPLIVLTKAQTPEQILAPKTIEPLALAQAREVGAALATGLAMGIF